MLVSEKKTILIASSHWPNPPEVRRLGPARRQVSWLVSETLLVGVTQRREVSKRRGSGKSTSLKESGQCRCP